MGMGPYSAARGVFGLQGLGIHVVSGEEFSIKSSGWTNNFGIKTSTGDAYIRGNLGIGTTSPTRKLDVSGSAAISGHVGIGAGAAPQDHPTLYVFGDGVDTPHWSRGRPMFRLAWNYDQTVGGTGTASGTTAWSLAQFKNAK